MARKRDISHSSGSRAKEEVQLIMRLLDGLHHRMELLQSQDEQRVRLFLTMVSGSVAVLALIVQFGKVAIPEWLLVSIVLFSILLIYGIETLHSLNWSKIHTRECSAAAMYLDRLLASTSRIAASVSSIQSQAELFKAHAGLYRATLRGNLVEFMYLTNTLLFAGVTYMLGVHFAWNNCVQFWSTSTAFLASLLIQYFYSHWIRNVMPMSWVNQPLPPA